MGAAASVSSRPASSRPPTVAKASSAGPTPPCRCLPEEIIIYEILVRLPPKSLLRCRAVCRAWRHATSTRDFLLAHHDRQPSLPIVWDQSVSGSEHSHARYKDFFAFDNRATNAQLQPVAQLDQSCRPEAFCDGLLLIYNCDKNYSTICNPVTREHCPLRTPQDFLISNILGMYLHRPTGEYRLLLHRRNPQRSVINFLLCRGEIECYVFALGSDEPPRRIQWPDVASGLWFRTPALARDSLHWFPEQDQGESRPVIVFDATAESFRQMRAPVVPTKSNIFEMDGTLGIYSCNDDMKAVYIWVLQNYEGEVWEFKYQVELPVAKIRGRFGRREAGDFYVSIVSAGRDILLLLSHGGSLFYVDIDGKLVGSFHRDGQHLSANGLRLKQTLVPHNFFTALKDYYAVSAPPFIWSWLYEVV